MSQKIMATVTAKGQITIPAAHRRAWGLRPGDKIAFDPPGAHPVTIEPKRKRSIFELLDAMPPLSLGRALRQEDIEQAIGEEMTAQELRSKSGR